MLPSGRPPDAALADVERAATDFARRGGAVLLEHFRTGLDVSFKWDDARHPVTEVDHAVEDLIRAAVLARFPEHGILGEERADTGPADAEWIWVIDPLDGTSNFINGLPTFSCSVGVLWRGAPVVGAIFVATSRHLSSGVYHARAGGGAFFDDRPVRFGM